MNGTIQRPKRKRSEDIDALIEENLPRLQQRYGSDNRVINWSAKQVRYHFAIRDGLLQESDVKTDRLSKDWLIMMLSDHVEGEFWKTWHLNTMLDEALKLNIISEEQYESSWSGIVRCVKCYLWTLIGREYGLARKKMKEYASVCSEVMIRGSILANLMATFAIRENRVDEMFAVLKKDKIRQVMLPEFFAPEKRERLVNDVLEQCADCILPCPRWERVMSRSGWDNALKYLSNKYLTAVACHVYVHITARCKKYIDATCDQKDACKALFFQGKTEHNLSSQDLDRVQRLRSFIGAATGALKQPEKLTSKLFELHILLLTSDVKGIKGSVMPVSSWSRSYHRACARVFNELMKSVSCGMRFEEAFSPSMVECKLRDSRKKKRKSVRSRMKGRAFSQKRKNVQRSFYRMKNGRRVSSIETDGYGVSLVVNIPIDAKIMEEKEEDVAKRMQKQTESFLNAYKNSDSCVLAGNDLGRRNFYTISFSTPQVTPDIPNLQFARSEWLRMIRDNDRKRFYKMKDDTPCVREFLTESSSTSKKTADFDEFKQYARTICRYRHVLKTHFILDDARCGMAMVCFRRRRSAMHRLTNRIFRHVWKHGHRETRFVLGSGTGSFGGGAVKGEKGSVPVKEMLRYMVASFKRLGQPGRLWKHLDEFYTTKMCYKHGIPTKDHHQKNCRGHTKKWKNINVRRCAKCASEKNELGLIDRDGNAAQNILLVLKTLLEEGAKARPEHLRRPTKKRPKLANARASSSKG
jgi:hypothetical protein